MTQYRYSYQFDISPVQKARPRFFAKGSFRGAYTPKKTREFETKLALLAQEQHVGPPLIPPLKVKTEFVVKRPITVKRTVLSVKPDLDNLIKSLFDALNGIVWMDDVQIVELVSLKRYTEKQERPHIKLWIDLIST